MFRTKKEKNAVELAEFIDNNLADGNSVVFETDNEGWPTLRVFSHDGEEVMKIYVNRYGAVRKARGSLKEIGR